MRVIKTAAQLSFLIRVETAVERTTRRLAPQKGDLSFPTAAPNGAQYGPIPVGTFLRKVEEWELSPQLRMADLGSGLGGVCLAASIHFGQITGFELDPTLYHQSELLRQRFGIGNVSFRQENFLTADLTSFDLLYAYHPFGQNFVQLMSARFHNTRPGTLIFAVFFNAVVPLTLPAPDFTQLSPNPGTGLSEADPLCTEFRLFRRN